MKNVTISMDDDLHKATRIEAAKSGKSVSRYIADQLREIHSRGNTTVREVRNPQREAFLRMLEGPPLHIAIDGKMPTADERNAR